MVVALASEKMRPVSIKRQDCLEALNNTRGEGEGSWECDEASANKHESDWQTSNSACRSDSLSASICFDTSSLSRASRADTCVCVCQPGTMGEK